MMHICKAKTRWNLAEVTNYSLGYASMSLGGSGISPSLVPQINQARRAMKAYRVDIYIESLNLKGLNSSLVGGSTVDGVRRS